MKIRKPDMQDAAAIARVHVQAWHESYRGIVPDDFLARLSVDGRQKMWENVLANTGSTLVFVAENPDGEIVGFTSAGQADSVFAAYDSELYTLYLLQKAQGIGIGSALFQTITHTLSQQGTGAMYLWVLAENIRARRFYERAGGIQIGSKTETFGDRELIEIAYGWNPIPTAPESKRDER